MDEILASIRNMISEEDRAEAHRRAVAERELALPEDADAEEGYGPDDLAVSGGPQTMHAGGLNGAGAGAGHKAPEEAHGAAAAQPPSQDEALRRASQGTAQPRTDRGDTTRLLSEEAANQAYDSLRLLARQVSVSREASTSLEDVVERLLTPMLREWLDRNLPAIVEEKVEAEIQRLTRQR
jgi:cell pole-organizing protein PopZ